MSASSNQKKSETAENTEAQANPTVEVLYQKLGDKWYAFSIIGEDVFFGSVPPELQTPNLPPKTV